MPTSKPAAAPPPDSTGPEPTPAPTTAPGPQAYQYTAPFSTVYGFIPLTAHPADGDRPATVFAWPGGAPDGRWVKTSKQPNQRPDNDPASPLSPAASKEV